MKNGLETLTDTREDRFKSLNLVFNPKIIFFTIAFLSQKQPNFFQKTCTDIYLDTTYSEIGLFLKKPKFLQIEISQKLW